MMARADRGDFSQAGTGCNGAARSCPREAPAPSPGVEVAAIALARLCLVGPSSHETPSSSQRAMKKPALPRGPHDAFGQRYGNWQKYHNRNPFQQLLIKRFLKTVGLLVAEAGVLSVVDVGCAEGFVIKHLRALRPHLKCYGIDVDREALRRGRLIQTSFAVQQANAFNLPYAANSVDLTMCLEVLEHLEDPESAIAELMRVSRRYCLFSVPHEPFFRIANLVRGKSIRQLGNDIEHINHWGVSSFSRFLEGMELSVCSVERSFPWLVALTKKNHEA